ncbi:PQQ-binding-like beta-propeller repeat protein [Actinophytocola sp.]|uniref:outer membrane protein assembly factor BamB family protein n=1 Tax=Actinophytocola sp. TaxID=1872138 RepID=UPI002ED78CC2
MNRTVLGAVGALVAVAAVAVALVVTDDPGRQQPGPTVAPAPRPVPVLLDEEPEWSRLGALAAPEHLSVRDGTVLMYRPGELSLVDLRTGEPRWTVRTGAALPGGPATTGTTGTTGTYDGGGLLVGDGVLVRYRAGPRTGIARLAAADGSVAWRRELAGPLDLVTADDRRALVMVGGARVVALDVGRGGPLWERTGLWPYAIAGDVVVGETVRGVRRTGPPTEGTVAAWNLATGAPAWTLADLAPARVTLTAGDVVLVDGFRTGRPERGRWVVDARTGRRVHEVGAAPVEDSCATDGRTLVACAVVEDSGALDIETFRVAGRRVETLRGDYRSQAVRLVGPDHLVAGDSRHFVALDRRGRVVARNLPYPPAAITGEYLLSSVGDPPLIAAYRFQK